MAKQKDNKELFTAGGCLSAGAIDRYLSSELNSKEKESVEKHISKCEFCNEAIEGYRETKLKDSIYFTAGKLNRKIKESVYKTTRILNSRDERKSHTVRDRMFTVNKKIIAYSSLAASILILAGLFLFINYLNIGWPDTITETMQKKEYKGLPEKAGDETKEPVARLSSDTFSKVVEPKATTTPEKQAIPGAARPPAVTEKITIIDDADIMETEEDLNIPEALSEPQSLEEISSAEGISIVDKAELKDIAVTEEKVEKEAVMAAPVKLNKSMGKSRVKYTKRAALTAGQEYEEVIAADDLSLDDYTKPDTIYYDKGLEMEFLAFEEEAGEGEVFVIVEDMPKFMGEDMSAFRAWIQQNLKYPETAAENGISGKVFVQFTVNEKGKVVDAKVIRGIDPSLDKEALRVIKSSPKWEPGKQRGRAVKVLFTFPVVFVLE